MAIWVVGRRRGGGEGQCRDPHERQEVELVWKRVCCWRRMGCGAGSIGRRHLQRALNTEAFFLHPVDQPFPSWLPRAWKEVWRLTRMAASNSEQLIKKLFNFFCWKFPKLTWQWNSFLFGHQLTSQNYFLNFEGFWTREQWDLHLKKTGNDERQENLWGLDVLNVVHIKSKIFRLEARG